MKRKQFLTLIFLALCFKVCAQGASPSTINTMGGHATISGNDYAWSIGEMTLVHTWNAGNFMVSQGVLQPKDGMVPVSNITKNDQSLSIYPNPATTEIFVHYQYPSSGIFEYKLTDVVGKLILQREFENVSAGTDRISLSALSNGYYLLQVSFAPNSGEKEMKAFKVQKIQ
ncbi:MAG: T9SS type A sorting domain-containing protein [Bacteroidetes bacterium]|nr:T9SS type A sorting domain-containing protein [Bacteroidota bacterium]MBS1740855.1 T9SS type A sorting domain-containing protein [Bacteroidota bacterium]